MPRGGCSRLRPSASPFAAPPSQSLPLTAAAYQHRCHRFSVSASVQWSLNGYCVLFILIDRISLISSFPHRCIPPLTAFRLDRWCLGLDSLLPDISSWMPSCTLSFEFNTPSQLLVHPLNKSPSTPTHHHSKTRLSPNTNHTKQHQRHPNHQDDSQCQHQRLHRPPNHEWEAEPGPVAKATSHHPHGIRIVAWFGAE